MIRHTGVVFFGRYSVVWGLLLAVTGLASPSVPATAAPSPQGPISATRPLLPLVFEPNQGQTDASVRFVARGGDYTVFLTGEGAVLALRGAEPVRLRPVCAQTPIAAEGLEPTGGTSNYFKGADSSRWKTGIPNYRRVRYTGACPGVDITYYGNPQRLEYDFVLAPWTNPDTVRVEYEGAKSLRISANGDLILSTGAGDLVQPRPLVYQEIGGRRVVVEAGYRLAGHHGVTFALANYRRDVPLVIDPVLFYSTYIGGSGGDAATAIAVDSAGNAYITGQTLSLDFPTAAAEQATKGGTADAFAMKISADGQTRLYSTYLGGASTDFGTSIAVDGNGNAYIAGGTASSNFPTVNAFQTSQAGSDGFVAKLNSTGSSLLYSTYLGGTGQDQVTGIAVDSAGNAYVAGFTNSTNFPSTPGAFQTSNRGTPYNAFVTKLSTTGNSLVYSTLLGGTGVADLAFAIAVDGLGNAYVAGATSSVNFPLTPGAMQTANAGLSDAFVTKINASGTALLYSTLFGGTGDDNTAGIQVDGSGNAYITGTTSSRNLPTLNAAQGTYGGGTSDGFVAKLNSTGSGLIFSTYLGGSGNETPAGIAIDGSGNSYITGQTGSANFPIVNPIYSTGGTFVTALNAAGNAFLYSTHLTGDATDSGSGIAFGGTGSLYITGRTTSASFPTQNALQASKPANVNQIGFVTVIGPQPLRFVPVTPCRVADTRNAAGPFGGPVLGTGASRDFNVPASACGIPANALAYSLNVTVVPVGPLGFLSIWPAGQSQPTVSTLNSGDGRIKANAAIVPSGVNGAVTLFASDATHAIIDINGYFVPAATAQSLAFYPITPCRIADTRSTAGALGGPGLTAGASRSFPILAGPCALPATAQAYALNMTVVPAGPLNFLSAWPTGSPQTGSSTINAPTGTITPNMAIVPAGVGGAISVFASDATHLIVDITGYFAPPGAGSLDFYAATPCRILDTRNAAGTFGGPLMGAGESRAFPVPSSTCNIPATAKAYSLNATVVPPAPLAWLTMWGSGAMPFVSTLNAYDGTIMANGALVPAGANGVVTAFTTNASHLILDVNGYFQ